MSPVQVCGHQRGEPAHGDAAQDPGGQGEKGVGSRDSNPAGLRTGAPEAGREVRGDQGAKEYAHQVAQFDFNY